MNALRQAAAGNLFDAAGTLFHLPRGVGYHYALVARRFGVELDEARLNGTFSQVWSQMPALVTTGPRPDDDRGWWRQFVDKVLDECGGPVIDRDAYFSQLYPHFLEPGFGSCIPRPSMFSKPCTGDARSGSSRISMGACAPFCGRSGLRSSSMTS
jgi:hypothetical protein